MHALHLGSSFCLNTLMKKKVMTPTGNQIPGSPARSLFTTLDGQSL
jgi:hypothetical protein